MNRSIVTVAALFAAGVGTAGAQDIRGVPVADRPRADYDPLGIRAGAFLVRPSIIISGAYDDNIFAEDAGKSDDLLFIASPALTVQSDWNVHDLRLRGAAEIGRYNDFSSEDYEDYNVGADARLDITQGDFLNTTLDYRREHDERGSPDDAGGRKPTEYDLVFGRIGYERRGRRISFRAAGTVNDYDFDDVPAIDTAIIDQDFRDRIEYAVSSRVGYEFRPDMTAFVQGVLNWREYDDDVRNSDGYRIDGGFAFDLGGVTTGELFAGYREQDYVNPMFDTENGLSYGGSVLWNPTGLTSVQLRLVNQVNESINVNASGYLSSGASVQVDHELRRNILIGGLIGYTENNYKGVERVEKYWNAEANADYLLNRNLRVGLSYRLTNRDVNLPDQDYTRNILMLSLKAGL